MQNPQLAIQDMDQRHSGLTAGIAAYLAEGARVCLDRHHRSPATFEIRRLTQTVKAIAQWQATDENTKSAWANETDTTEIGACACVLAAVELMEGFIAVRRAETRTGADYYIAAPGTPDDDIENCIRLEVSGIDRGNAAAVARRLREKLAQAKRGDSNLPAMAGVIGFRALLISLARLEDS